MFPSRLLSASEKPHFATNSSLISVRPGCRCCHRNLPENQDLQIAGNDICSRRKEKHLCLVKSVKSSHAASAVGLSAFIWGATAKRASAPTTIGRSTARYGT